MPLTSNFDQQVVERMLEYVDVTSAWTRRLWSVNPITELRELLECSQAIANGTLTGGTLQWLRGALIDHVMKDPGLGAPQARAGLKALLPKDDLVANSHDWHVLRLATDAARRSYLATWASALTANTATTAAGGSSASCPSPHRDAISIERCSSNIASFLLDEGLSATWIHRWLSYHKRHNSSPTTLPDLLAEADAKISAGKSLIKVLVTFSKQPGIPHPPPEGWLPAGQVAQWRTTHGCGSGGLRQYGGLVVEVEAFEAHGAVLEAAERVGRVRARFDLGSRRRRFEPHDQVWVEKIGTPFPMAREVRRVEVHSLERSDQLYNLSVADPAVDAALELLEPALDGQKTSAIAGAWACVESLLSGPGDRANVEAADRLARIVACSYVRHELTTLAWEHKINAVDGLAAAIDACADNRSRAALMEAHIIGGHTPSWSRPCDELSYLRMRKILPPVGQGLADIEGYMRDAFRRLYRQRNLVLHSGKTDAIAVDAALRTALPLVASGMDRIVAASVEQQVSAIELAARAKFAMDQYASGGISSIVDLLA